MTAIDEKYVALGGTAGFLGEAVIPEQVAPDGVGRYRHYRGGSIYWNPTTGAHEVHGSIRPLQSCDQVLRNCLTVLQNYDAGAITRDELDCMLFDDLLARGEFPANCWEECFQAVPVPVLRSLFVACPTARMFSPPRYTEAEFAALRAEFAVQLARRLSQGGPSAATPPQP